jgi:hypothetical protein
MLVSSFLFLEVIKFLNFYRIPVKKWTFHNIMKFITYFLFFGIIYTIFCFFLCFAICYTQSEAYGCWFETWKSLMRNRPFNLQKKGGGGLWFFVSFRNLISDNIRVRIFFCLSREAQFFFPEFNIRLYGKNSESYYIFFPLPKSEYFFQHHWESEYFLRKKNITPTPRS